jgi:hypothetical protein
MRESTPIPRTGATPVLSLVDKLPDDEHLPEQSAAVPNANYVVVQAIGGPVGLAGPVVAGMANKSRAQTLADQFTTGYAKTPLGPIAFASLSKVGIGKEGTNAPYTLRPFVFIQYGYDEKFRLSLVYHVEAVGTGDRWIGRYTYLLPTAIPFAQFTKPSTEQLSYFEKELTIGGNALAALIARDLAGELPAKGKKVDFGSLYFWGPKMSALGLTTMPEEIYYRDADLIEDANGYVVLRVRGNTAYTGMMGGTTFGVLQADKTLLHTLKVK